MNWRAIGTAWLDFLFGNPRRTLLIIVFLIIITGNLPGILGGILGAMAPLVEPLLCLALIIFGIRWMIMGPPRRGGGGNHR